jgi:protein TonB
MLALTRISAEVEAIIPNPDPPPPAFEPGPRSAAIAGEATLAPIEQVAPAYPVAAKTLGAEGSVTLRVAVLPDGSVAAAFVISCTRPGLGFEAAALAAVKRWRFAPAPLQSGSREVPVTVQFQRQRPHP